MKTTAAFLTCGLMLLGCGGGGGGGHRDDTPPQVTAFSVPATSATLAVAITSFTATDDVGVAGYLVTEPSTAPAASDPRWSAAAPTSYTFTAPGAKTLHAWAKDAAGNVSTSRAASVVVLDVTAPTVTAFTLPATSSALTVGITSLTATDDVGVTGYLVTESSTAPAAGAAGWAAAPPASFTFTAPGAKTLHAWAKDAAGNVSAGRAASVEVLDVTAPTLTAFTVPDTTSTLQVFIGSLAATDDVGVTGYLVTEASTAPAADDPRWSALPPLTYTFTAPGAKTLHAWAKDAAGNVSTSLTASIEVLDVTAPLVTAFTLPATSSSLTVNIVTFTASDDVAVTGYLVTESAAAPAPGAGWTASPPATFSFAAPGMKTLYAWARDAAGNVSSGRSASVDVLDVGGPVVTAFTLPATSTSLTVSILTFTATDDVAVAGYLVTESATPPTAGAAGWTAAPPTAFTFAAPGAKTLHAWAKDAAGNVSASRAASVTVLDVTAPTVTAFALPATSDSLDVPITTLAATDDVAVTGYLVTESATAPAPDAAGWTAAPPSSYGFAAPGAKTLHAWARDAAGNVSAGRTAAVEVRDVTAPTITAFSLPATSSTLQVFIGSLTATDDVLVTGYLVTESSTAPAAGDPGWSALPPLTYTFAAPGAKTLHAWAKDAAGNVSTGRTAAVEVLDVTAPVVVAFTLPATSSSLTVNIGTFTASDDVGVTGYLVTESATAPAPDAAGWTAAPPATFTFAAAAPGVKTLHAWARDAAGNVSTGLSASVEILDVTAPTVTAFALPATSSTLTVPITSLAATDDVAVTGYLVTESATAPAPGAAGWAAAPPTSFTFATLGAKTLHAWARDAAGNVSAGRSASVVITLPRPEPAGWYAGDPHVHRSCGGAPESVESMAALMSVHDLSFMSLLADMGNAEVQDADVDLPRVNGADDPLSTPGRVLRWDAEWHWDPIYMQYEHQVLGGHLVALGLSHAEQRLDEYTAPVLQWASAQGGAAGFAHLQYLDGFLPTGLTCCTPLEYPVEVALGTAAFVSEDVVSGDQSVAMGMDPEAAVQAYYRLLNTGFRPGFAAGTDYPCNGGAAPGALLTYVRIPEGQPVTYDSWVQGIAAGRTVVSRNGHREFLDLRVNGTAGPGDQVDLAGAGSVTVSVTWTATEAVEAGTLQLLVDGTVVASQPAAESPTTLTRTVPFTRSGWIAARRTTGNGHQVQTGAAFVRVDALPVRASAADAYYFVQWIDNLLAHTAPGVGDWAPFFPAELATVRARYQAARTAFQAVLAASPPAAPQTLFTTEVPAEPPANDATPYELGTRFLADLSGQITAVRLYAVDGEQGVHAVRIWQAGNPVPVSGPHDWDIAAGAGRWVTFTLPAPVPVAAGVEYTVAVSTGSDLGYAARLQTFAGGIVNGHLYAPRSAGVFSDMPGTRPTQSFAAASYFRDVVFEPTVP